MRAPDRGLGGCDRINLIVKTLIKPLNATPKKIKFNTKSIYSESTSKTYSESTSKIMVRSRWTVYKILLMSAWDFMEKNILTLSINY